MSYFLVSTSMVFGCSLLISSLISLLHLQSFSFTTARDDLSAVQASHVVAVPRIGGVAVVSALTLGILLWFGRDPTQPNFIMFLATMIPIFIVGLSEDLGFSASPRARLLAAAVSGTLYVFLFNIWLPRTDVLGLDMLMTSVPFAITFSLFMAVGVSHAFNLIDGLNGLAALTSIFAALALAAIANAHQLDGHRDALLLLSIAIAGFLVLNFPFGRIFLGDAGAYVIGHVLVWTSISILWHVPSVTPLAILLIFFWPIADTLLAIVRRLASGAPVAMPDRLHFHQMVMRAVEILFLGRDKRRIANPIATVITLPFLAAPMVAGVLLATQATAAASACLFFAFLIAVSYKAGMTVASRMKNRRSA